MRNIVYAGIFCAGTALVAMTVPAALGQRPFASDDRNTVTVKPRQPGGLLGDQLGTYLTIEGVKSEGVKEESGTLVVDTVNGVAEQSRFQTEARPTRGSSGPKHLAGFGC